MPLSPFPDVIISGDLPRVITPSAGSPLATSLAAAVAWVSTHEASILQLLSASGAVLFRGFALSSADSFSAFVSAFSSLDDLPYEDSLSYAVRLPVTGRVCTTNEGKLGGMTFHHEQAAAPRFPSKLFFFCETPATSGGGTGVSPSWVVHDALAQLHPAFLADCAARGVRYRATLPPEQSRGDGGVGRSWRSFFGVTTREEAEARLAHYGYEWAWLPGDALDMTTPVLSAVRRVPGPAGIETNVFFNQMAAQALTNAAEFAAAAAAAAAAAVTGGATNAPLPSPPPPALTFGDGRAVPLEPLRFVQAQCEAAAVNIEWQQGDVALLDNFLVLHARRAYEGPRRVLASLCT